MMIETASGEPSSRLLQKSETSRSTIWGSSIICSKCNECKSTKSFNKEEAKKRDGHRICNACGPPLPKDLNVLTIDQLKSKLRERKSDLSGKKSDLVVRLQALVHKEQWLDEFLDDNDKGQKSSTCKASPNLQQQQTRTHANTTGVNSTETSTLTHELILSLKVADLKKELKGRGLPVSGLKTDLQKRLAEANGCFATSANKNASKSAGRPITQSETKKKRPELKFDWTHTALYIGMVGVIKFFFPWLITYCATRTFATSLFSLWMPFLQTVNLIHRYRGQHFRQLASEQGEKEDTAASQESSPIVSTGTNAGTECDDPMDTWDDISLDTSSTSEPSNNSTKSEAEAQKLSSMSSPNADEIDATTDDLKEEALDLLKYWVVYTILCALSQVIYLTPILGRLFSKYYQTPTKAFGSTSYFRRFRGTAPKRFTSCFMSEMQLLFYIWLYFLPLNLFAGEKSVNSDESINNDQCNKHKSSTIPETSMDTFSNRPLDLVYDRFSEYAVSLHDSTNMLAARAETEADTAGMLQSAVSRFKSGLDLAVLVRFMSNETKESIISILSSSVALLPAAITLMMPGHLTEFGVVYVKAVVPAAKSSHVCRTANESDKDSPDGLTSAIRFLEYWIMYSVLSGILAILAPFLAWVPLSTHFIFLVWSYAQLENPVHGWYEIFEKELISFGLMQPHDIDNGDCSQLDISETVTVRILKKMASSLPNGLTSPRPKSKITHGTETSEEETVIVNADEMEVEVQLDLPPLLRKASSEESEASPGQSTTEQIE